MLRKTTYIVLALFLLVSTTGITFSMHYCGGKLISTSINKEAKTCCDGTGNCCKNKTVHFEVKDDFVSPLQVEINKTVELELLFPILFVFNINLFRGNAEKQEVYTDTSPPPDIQTTLSLLQAYRC